MNEWSFCTTHPDGRLISMDGSLVEGNIQDYCKNGGWDIEHSHYAVLPDYWYLILSRPFVSRTVEVKPMHVSVGVQDEASADLRSLSVGLANLNRITGEPKQW